MRNILRLIRRDLHKATSNVMAGVVVFGLVIIPALFTWFNVIASWDPFAATGNLKVAVANSDSGYQSDLVPIRINVGEQVVSALRANHDLDWVITSENNAIDGTKSGEYYAAIVLPSSFSTDMLTFFADGGQTTHIDYFTNEKRNALTPTITGQGAEGVRTKIDQTFAETLSDVALGLVSSLSDFLSSGETKAVIESLSAKAGTTADQLHAAAQTADLFTVLIDGSIPLLDGAAELVSASQSAFDDASTAVGGGIGAVRDLQSTLVSTTDSLKTSIEATILGYEAVGTAIDQIFAGADRLSSDQATAFTDMAQRVQVQIDQYTSTRDVLVNQVGPLLPPGAQPAVTVLVSALDRAIGGQETVRDRLIGAADGITSGNQNLQDVHQNIVSALSNAKQSLTDAKDSYSSALKPKLDELASTLTAVEADAGTVGEDLRGAATNLVGGAGSLSAVLAQSRDSMQQISEKMEEGAQTFSNLQQSLDDAADTGDFSAVREIIGADPGALATSLAQPVKLERTAVFPVVSFGAGMAPLYTVLSLWVGALLMTVTIKAGVGRHALPDGPELTTTEKYLGRYGIFAIIGLAQSTLVTVGLILFVQIEPVHPFLFVIAGWITSLVFTLLIYTAVVAFGNAGKALAVLLLVIQISGSGGAYPLPLLPAWFQAISPFLPATHAINALRAAIAGLYQGDYWASLGLLLLFVPVALLLGLVLRRPLINFNRNLMAAVESTKLM